MLPARSALARTFPTSPGRVQLSRVQKERLCEGLPSCGGSQLQRRRATEAYPKGATEDAPRVPPGPPRPLPPAPRPARCPELRMPSPQRVFL